jgi:uncharacterized protein DUF6152
VTLFGIGRHLNHDWTLAPLDLPRRLSLQSRQAEQREQIHPRNTLRFYARRWLLKGKFLFAFAVIIGVSILALPLAAHHGNAAYDATKQVNLKGTVTQFIWANPHCVVLFDVNEEGGQPVHWMAETENPTTMTNMGWLKSSLKPGDPITIRVITVKNGKPIGRIVWVETASGQKLPGRLLPTVDKAEDESKQ